VLRIPNFLKDRSTTIRLDDFTSNTFPIQIGLPQGLPLSVILYFLYNNSLLNISFFTSLDLFSIVEVDDVVHLVVSTLAESVRKLLIEEGQPSILWGDSHIVIFDQAKAQFLWLSKGNIPDGGLPFGNQHLASMTDVKWLGIWLDQKLLFNKNFRALEEKAHKTFNQLKIFCNSCWGTKESDRLIFIKSVLVPRLTYGAATPNKGKVGALANKADHLVGIFALGFF
jgi:hypothetical protein